MTITLKDFKELSKRTAPFLASPTNKQEWNNIIANYSVGLVGEHLEYELELTKVPLDGSDISEELLDKAEGEVGDVLHYAVNLLNVLGEEYDESHTVKFLEAEDITEALKDILEIHKKHIYHGHEFKKDEYIKALYIVISEFKNLYGNSLGYILKKNIDKLKKRYPEKFTTEDSIKRVDV